MTRKRKNLSLFSHLLSIHTKRIPLLQVLFWIGPCWCPFHQPVLSYQTIYQSIYICSIVNCRIVSSMIECLAINDMDLRIAAGKGLAFIHESLLEVWMWWFVLISIHLMINLPSHPFLKLLKDVYLNTIDTGKSRRILRSDLLWDRFELLVVKMVIQISQPHSN